jgi:predicted permease
MFIKRPGPTAAVLLTLMLGIGANVAIFSVIYAVLLRPLPYEEPDRLVRLYTQYGTQAFTELSEPEFLDLRERAETLAESAVYLAWSGNVTGDDEPERVSFAWATASLFPLLGQEAALGRVFTADEDRPGGDRVAVLGNGFWQRRFGADPSIVGQSLILDGESYTVIGVMPREFRFPSGDLALWLPLAIDTNSPGHRGRHYLDMIARLDEGADFEQARAEISNLSAQFAADYPDFYGHGGHGWRLAVVPLMDEIVGGVRPALVILAVAVGGVMLLACLNIASLLLARGTTRGAEVAVRQALGASRLRIVRQMLAESLLLSLVGGVLGIAVAYWGLRVLLPLAGASIPRAEEIGVNVTVLVFAFLLSLFTGLAFGLVPALRASRFSLQGSLRVGTSGLAGIFGLRRLLAIVVTAEFAATVVLLISTGLIIKSFVRLQAVDPGFAAEGALTMKMSLPRNQYGDAHRQAAFYQELLAESEQLPGVKVAGLGSHLPLTDDYWSDNITIEDYTLKPGEAPFEFDLRSVSGDYFEAMAIELRNGRVFTDLDTKEANGVAIIDEALARRFWPDRSPLGRRLRIGSHHGGHDAAPWLTIVGVVAAVKQDDLGQISREQIYLSFLQTPPPFRMMNLVVRTAGDPRGLIGPIRDKVKALDPDLPLFRVATLKELVESSLALSRFTLYLMIFFAVIATVLACVGVYGVMSYTVSWRTREMGLRMALGAGRGDVFKLILKEATGMTLIGVVLGVVAAVAATRTIASLLYGVSSSDPLVFTLVVLLLVVIAVVASAVPARRASRIAPVAALRYE